MSSQRASKASFWIAGPSAGEAPHHGNRFVGCRAVEGHERGRDDGTFSSSDDGQTLLARESQGLTCAGDSSQSIPRMESAGGDQNLMGGRPDHNQHRAGWEGEGPMPETAPCGRVKGHERKQPDRTPAGGGHGWKHAKVRMQRA